MDTKEYEMDASLEEYEMDVAPNVSPTQYRVLDGRKEYARTNNVRP
jgi:hypothetical protein